MRTISEKLAVNRKLVTTLASVALLVLLGCGWIIAHGDSLNQLLPSLRPSAGPKSSGSSVSWSKMLALADQEAAKIDRDAVLSYGAVGAEPPGTFDGISYTGPFTGSLLVRFDYDRPNGGSFWIEFEDSDPQKTVYRFTRFSGPSETRKANFNRDFGIFVRGELSKVKISPREAVAATWGEAQAEAQRSGQKNISLEPLVSFSPWSVSWNVDYWLHPLGAPAAKTQQLTSTPTRNPLDFSTLFDPSYKPPGLLMGFDVSAETGQITDRSYIKLPRSTPTQLPIP